MSKPISDKLWNILQRFSQATIKAAMADRPEVSLYGGELNPAVVVASPDTLRGKYKKEKKEFFDAKRKKDSIAKEILNHRRLGVYTTEEEMLPVWERIVDLPNVERERDEYKEAKDQWLSSIGGINSLPAQLYRYYSRHFGYKKNQEEHLSGRGTDIIDLSHNVIRLTPNSKQSTALFNDFIEKRNPSVLRAGEYKNNPDRLVGDKFAFPARNISIFGGIEEGKFKLDSLKNFSDSTTIIPARNIKKGIPKVSRIILPNKISREFDYDKYSLGRMLQENSLMQPLRALELYYNTPESKEFAERRIDYLDSLLKAYPVVFKNLPQGLSHATKVAEEQKQALNEIIGGNMPKNRAAAHRIGVVMQKNGVIPRIESSEIDPLSFLVGDKSPYMFVDESGNEHNISDFEANLLDGKTILANPKGGVFVGRLQDISHEQLDSLNKYLLDNPSWIMRPDLGSFDQYRLDNPSLATYLRQYFEHPKPSDSNVYTVGTTTPNILWTTYTSGGEIHIDPSKKGTFTAAATKHGKSVQAFASQVLANKENYSPAMVKKAVFAKNFGGRKRAEGGFLLDAPEYPADEEQTKYARDAKSSYGDTYYDIVNSRYTGAMNALKRKGFSYADAERLAPMIVTQNNLEGGWRLNRADNNFGGMRKNGKTLSFNSVDDFYDAYIDMLDEKWNAGTSPHSSWRHTRNLDEWAKVLNHEDLNLWSKERWEAYNREHKDEPVYLYAPQWENNNKTYREHLRGVEGRTAAYLDMVRRDNPVKNWDIQPEETPVQKATKENPSLLLALINKLRGK